jgi:secondary thiamine-phosphate synthase enzyme
MEWIQLEVDTSEDVVVDLTPSIRDFCVQQDFLDGLVHVFAPHATAGLAIMETGSGSEADLGEALGRLFPRDVPYGHAHGSVGHGADHVIPAFISPSLVLAYNQGNLVLGQWQSVVLVDPNPDNNARAVLVHFLGAAG